MLPENEQEVRPKHVGALINNIVQQSGVKYNAAEICSNFFVTELNFSHRASSI